ncbi:hypothetical protein CEXT_139381, partial [Caerostris extrusa]
LAESEEREKATPERSRREKSDKNLYPVSSGCLFRPTEACPLAVINRMRQRAFVPCDYCVDLAVKLTSSPFRSVPSCFSFRLLQSVCSLAPK